MVREQESEQWPAWRQRLRRLLAPNIRGKIILPYLILTLIVAISGTYVVTSLVASTLDERLTNQLLEAGRVVSDSLARREMSHLESARTVAFTVGLAEAVQAGDRETVIALAQPVAVVRGVENLIVVDTQGQEMLHMLRRADGSYEFAEGQFDTAALWMVQALLETGNPNELPKRGLVVHPLDQRYYYLTAIPFGLKDRMAGVVVVGTSLDTLLPYFKITSLADVVIYLDGGRAVATTFTVAEQPADVTALLDELSTTPALYESALSNTSSTAGENVRIRGRSYRLARGPIRVGNDNLGVFAVALPSQFIIRAGTTSRNTYALIFSAAMAGVILVGYLISQHITRPLSRLVRTSQAVAEGDLEQRTGIVSADEIGILADTFDEMTGRLSERTRALEEAIGRMRAILSSIGDGVVLEDMEGKLVPLNVAAELLLEEMADNFALGPLRELSVEDYDQMADFQPSPWLLERRRFQVGRKVISAHSAAVRTDDGEHLGTVIVLRDVTAEAEAERLKDAFITHVSHELRTPLTAIKGYSELLLVTAGDALDKEKLGFLETISRHTDNLVAMINELLDFSEMEAGGRLSLRRRPVQLTTLVEEIADEVRPQIQEKGLMFQVDTPAELSPVDADPRRLRWAVINLVRNAWQYTPTGGSVTLRLSEHDGQVILDVIDTGIGISPENQKHLFSRFYRVTNVTADDVRGLGLGLYVTRAIVEAHGGSLQIVSKRGFGSTFSVILPALQDHKGEKGAD
jgi:signal transduction histidine kinase/HAMP domain-containing protein